jgi:hypothetical protein
MKLADLLPAKVRGAIYTILGAAVALEAVWDVVPDPLEGKVLATLVALGFGLALVNTNDPQEG